MINQDTSESVAAVVLVDGEHYPPVIAAALSDLRARGINPVAAVFLGGAEKVAARGAQVDVGIPAQWVPPAPQGGVGVDVDAAALVLREVLARTDAQLVIDLSDEPVVDQRRRFQLAARMLAAGVRYDCPGLSLTPPPRPRLATRPTIAVIGTGKRTGKTALSGALVRAALAVGRTPVVIAMGRGGPPEPVVILAGAELDPAALLAVADAGGHAASDFYEDAVTTGAATVGARRCGGGPTGTVGHSNFVEALAAAEELPGDLLVFEGSGSAVPPVHADATLLVVPGDADPELIVGYLGAYRVLLADLVVATMCEPPRSAAAQVAAVLGAIRTISPSPLLRTVFRPYPLGPICGAKVFFATTAPAASCEAMAASLTTRFGCVVVATSSHLADRPGLRDDLAAAPEFDVLLVEVKAAAIDVAARMANAVGARVVFCDNRPHVTATGSGAGQERHDADASGEDAFVTAAMELIRLADQRHGAG